MAEYVRYRPGYPPALLDWLRQVAGFDRSWTIADVGSGTGAFSRLLLDAGNRVFAVEPNDDMRAEAERSLADHPGFVSTSGSAADTTLPDRSVDLVVAAQAFHWFDPEPTRREWIRILRPPRRVLVVFNSRRIDASPFMRAYEDLLIEHSVDYPAVDHRRVFGAALRDFAGGTLVWRYHFERRHDLGAVQGLSESSSYVPARGHPRHAPFMTALGQIFDVHASGGAVDFLYETEAYLGRLD